MRSEQVILVTGSSRGIGANLVEQFARAGHRVILNYAHADSEAEALYERVVGEVGRDRLLKVKASVARRTDVQRMFTQAIERFGRVDALVNNAGLNLDGPFRTMTDDQWERVLATNLTGPFLCAQEFAHRFRGEVGHIVNISAATAVHGRVNGANYCSSKAGVIALTKCLALELAPAIRVNCVFPGRVRTEEVMTRMNLHDPATHETIVRAIPMGRLGEPQDIYRVVRFLIEESDYITGQNFFVNGGLFMH